MSLLDIFTSLLCVLMSAWYIDVFTLYIDVFAVFENRLGHYNVATLGILQAPRRKREWWSGESERQRERKDSGRDEGNRRYERGI